MNQRKQNLPPCDFEIYERGEIAAVVADRKAIEIEKLVKEIAAETGERVDWHYFGGRGVVKVLGDVVKVRNAFRKHANPFLIVRE